MVSLKFLFLAFQSAVGIFSLPTDLISRDPYSLSTRAEDVVITTSTEGTANGFFFSCFIQSGSGATMNIGTGSYTLSWAASTEDVVAGVGWNPGAARTITYTSSISATGDSLLALYGWSTSPLVEYYVIEHLGTFNPGSQGTLKGTVSSDGGTYDIYEVVRTNAPSIQGTATFNQYLSIRTSARTSGTITFQNHINAWRNVGLDLGTFNYQIMATEGFESSGSSSMTIISG